MNLPMVAATLLGLTMLLSNDGIPYAKARVHMETQEPGGHYLDKPTETAQMIVDRPLNTLLKDQSMGAGLSLPVKNATLKVPYMKTKSDYYQEAMHHPGVRLVAFDAVLEHALRIDR